MNREELVEYGIRTKWSNQVVKPSGQTKWVRLAKHGQSNQMGQVSQTWSVKPNGSG